jgi:rubrerythrin
MKKLLLLAVLAVFAFTGCQQAKPVKTIENLKAGIKGETTASAKYAAFATKAQEEGNLAVAKLFEAASKAEGIHAANHKKVLEGLGEKMDEFTPEFEVKTTLENLQAALTGETYEIETMYPQFLADAATEKVEKATQSFNWASDTEKKHQEFYKNAITSMTPPADPAKPSTIVLPSGYAVCPVCGNTYDSAAIDDKCAFCQTPKDTFIMI